MLSCHSPYVDRRANFTNHDLTDGTPIPQGKAESEVGYPFSERGRGGSAHGNAKNFKNFYLSEGPGTD